jgi:hypothetical protein
VNPARGALLPILLLGLLLPVACGKKAPPRLPGAATRGQIPAAGESAGGTPASGQPPSGPAVATPTEVPVAPREP